MNGGQQITGRQRPLWVDTLGVWLAVLRTRARLEAGSAAPLLLGDSTPHALPRRGTIVAAQQDPTHALDAWVAAPRGGWRLAGKARPAGPQGCPPWSNAGGWRGRMPGTAGIAGTARTLSAG
jgi:hypothetical protein